MASNALEKSTNKSATLRFSAPTLSKNLWSVSPKTILIIFKNFLNIWFDAVEEQIIRNFNRNSGYVTIILNWTQIF